MRKRMTPSAGRRATRAVVEVLPLEGRRLLSLASPRPAEVTDATEAIGVPADTRAIVDIQAAGDPEPIHVLGSATNRRPAFYPIYRGPKRPELLAISTSGDILGTDLILTATVGGPILTKPANPGQDAIYTFGINRGSAPSSGTLPTRENQNVSFDSVVVVSIKQKGGIKGVVKYPDPFNPLVTVVKTLKSSSIVIHDNTLKVTVPISNLPSGGKAINQWRGAFFTRIAKPPGPRGIASLVPMFDDYPIGYRPK